MLIEIQSFSKQEGSIRIPENMFFVYFRWKAQIFSNDKCTPKSDLGSTFIKLKRSVTKRRSIVIWLCLIDANISSE